jgi:hypothetical protein
MMIYTDTCAGLVFSYLSPATTAALVSSTVLNLASYASIPLLGITLHSFFTPSPSSPEVTLVNFCSHLFSHYEAIRPSDAALGFSSLGILIAVKVDIKLPK